jgi:hypothetical protein
MKRTLRRIMKRVKNSSSLKRSQTWRISAIHKLKLMKKMPTVREFKGGSLKRAFNSSDFSLILRTFTAKSWKRVSMRKPETK